MAKPLLVFDAAEECRFAQLGIWNLDARAADEGRSFTSRSDRSGKPESATA